jgi:hypothetical protein
MSLRSRPALLLFLLALAVNSAAAWFVQRPGYTDAYYYFGGAKRLVQGFGFTEPYLWNYLDDPAGLPHASHLYWMPLTSILAAGAMAVCGSLCPDNAALFRAAQLPSILLASLLPLISLALAVKARHEMAGEERPADSLARPAALAAAWFTIFSGFYVVFWPNTDAFALYGVVGSLALVCAGLGAARGAARWFALAGLLSGLAHLTRADGVLLVAVALWFAVRPAWPLSPAAVRVAARRAGAAVGGYLVVMLPWFARNLAVSGSLLAPGGSRALWLTSYDDLFRFPPDLTLAGYLQAGWGAILVGKWQALVTNLQTAIAVHGLIALAPFILIGLGSLRRSPLFRPAILYAILLYFFMTFVFTFPGLRGGLFHSGAALLPFYFAAAPLGLERAVRWIARRRPGWRVAGATRVFLAGLGAIALAMTGFVYFQRVLGPDPSRPVWNQQGEVYALIGERLTGDPASVVVVNDPPAFTYFTDHPAVVVPSGGVDMLLAAAARYGARWAVLDANAPVALRGFYAGEESDGRLRLIGQFEDAAARPVYLYEITG